MSFQTALEMKHIRATLLELLKRIESLEESRAEQKKRETITQASVPKVPVFREKANYTESKRGL